MSESGYQAAIAEALSRRRAEEERTVEHTPCSGYDQSLLEHQDRIAALEARLLEAEQECSRLARKLAESQGREAAVILLRDRWQRRRKAARELNRKERKGLSAQQRDRAIGRFFGYREVVTELDECIETLSPTAEAIRRVAEAAEKETEAELRTERASGSEFDHYYDKIEPARDRRRAAVATLQALRASRPGVEKDGK